MWKTIEANSEDEPFLFLMYAGTRQEETAGWGWRPEELEPFLRMQFSLRERAYRLQYPHAERRIILLDAVRIGQMIVNESESELRLVDISLLPAYRNAGIGTSVLSWLQDASRASGKPVRLMALLTNPALALYMRLGFRIVREDGLYAELEWEPSPGFAAEPNY